MRDVASAFISHEQTQSNRACCFQTLDAVFPKDLFSDYLSHVMRKPVYAICEQQGADQPVHLRSLDAQFDQRLLLFAAWIVQYLYLL